MADYDIADIDKMIKHNESMLKNAPKFEPIELPKFEPILPFGMNENRYHTLKDKGYDQSEILKTAWKDYQEEGRKKAWDAFQSGQAPSPDGNWNADGTPRSNFQKRMMQMEVDRLATRATIQGRITKGGTARVNILPAQQTGDNGRSNIWGAFWGIVIGLIILAVVAVVVYIIAPIGGAILALLILLSILSG